MSQVPTPCAPLRPDLPEKMSEETGILIQRLAQSLDFSKS
ncbi:hypothetical protein ABIA45_000667 [Bradyrhizobium sp. USDA 336]